MKRRFADEQIIGFLREAEAGLAVAELCHRHGFSEASDCVWHSKIGSMIYLKLRQASELLNHKRVDRLYAEEGLQEKKLRRKKIPISDRHPLERPTAASQVWWSDFVFDSTAEWRSIKNLKVVDDAAHEAVDIVPERALGGTNLQHALVIVEA